MEISTTLNQDQPAPKSNKKLYACLSVVVFGLIICAVMWNTTNVKQEIESEVIDAFIAFKGDHNKEYASQEEESYRLTVFNGNYHLINKLNERKGVSHTVGINQFADLTNDEFRQLYTVEFSDLEERPPVIDQLPNKRQLQERELAATIDWCALGYCNQVKNQETCGSCWTFSGQVALEGLYGQQTGYLYSFSEQQMVDCVYPFLGQSHLGCNGGWPHYVTQYVQSHNNIYESQYPYVSGDWAYTQQVFSCNENGKSGVAMGQGLQSAYGGVDTQNLKQLITTYPILSIALAADSNDFQYYTSGVMDASTCGTALNHAVAVTGYGTENGVNYFTIRNSWGPNWGDNGYIKLGMDGHGTAGQCGIYQYVQIPYVG